MLALCSPRKLKIKPHHDRASAERHVGWECNDKQPGNKTTGSYLENPHEKILWKALP